jgi:hypothetical protein
MSGWKRPDAAERVVDFMNAFRHQNKRTVLKCMMDLCLCFISQSFCCCNKIPDRTV